MQTWYFAKNLNDLASYFNAQFEFHFGAFLKKKTETLDIFEIPWDFQVEISLNYLLECEEIMETK